MLTCALVSGTIGTIDTIGTSRAWAEPASLARIVPAQVRFFLELHGLREARQAGSAVTGGELWRGIATLAGAQPGAAAASVSKWGEEVEQALGMPTGLAIDVLFGDHVALAAPEIGRLDAGVLLSRITDWTTLDEWFALRRVVEDRPLPGVRRYRSGGRVWLARSDQVIVVSTGKAGTPLLEEVARLMAGVSGEPLADTAQFQAEVREVPPGHQGLAYFDLQRDGDDAPATRWTIPGWPPLRRGAAGLFARNGGLDLELRGLLAAPPVRPKGERVALAALSALPANTLAAYATTVDYAGAIRRVRAGRHPQWRLYLDLFETLAGRNGDSAKVLDTLGPQTLTVVGRSRQPSAPNADFIKPMASVLVQVREPAQVAEALHKAAAGLIGYVNIQALRGPGGADRPRLRVERLQHGQDTLYRVDLRQFARRLTKCVYFHSFEFCWSVADGWLILSTHTEHLRQILDARRAATARVSARRTAPLGAIVRRVCGGPAGADVSSLLVVRSAAAVEVVQSWLDYIEAQHPAMLEPTWWQDIVQRRGGERIMLGVGFATVPDHPGKLDVTTVLPGWPAAGRLAVGDRIIGIDKKLLTTTDARRDLNAAVRTRKNRDHVTLRVERAGRTMDVVVLLPADHAPKAAFNPIESIQSLIGLATHFSAGGYTTWETAPHRQSARLSLTLVPAVPRPVR